MRSRVCGSARAACRAVITAPFINSSVTGAAPSIAIPSTVPVAVVAARQLTGSMRNCSTRRSAAGTAAGTTPPVVRHRSCSVRPSKPRTGWRSRGLSSGELAGPLAARVQLCFAARGRYQLCFATASNRCCAGLCGRQLVVPGVEFHFYRHVWIKLAFLYV